MSDKGREEYLQKIRAVEEMDRMMAQGKGYTVNETQDSGGTTEAPSLPASTSVGSATYYVPQIKKYPDKIELPTGKSSDYNALARDYAQHNIDNDEMFGPLDQTRFDLGSVDCHRDGYLRKDMLFYLDELHDIVAPKIGVDKLYVTSSFRTLAYHAWLYRNSKSKVLTSPHLGGIAVDIAVTGNNRYILADAAYYMGFGGIAIGSNFVHIDIGPKHYWAYSPVPTYYSPSKKYG